MKWSLCMSSNLLLNHLLECFCREALWSFDGQTQCTVPDKRAEDTKCPRHTKQNSVVAHLCHTVVLCEGGKRERERERERERIFYLV